MYVIVYNLIRHLLQPFGRFRASSLSRRQAANDHGAALGRISFKGAWDTVGQFAAAIHTARATQRKQNALIEEMAPILPATAWLRGPIAVDRGRRSAAPSTATYSPNQDRSCLFHPNATGSATYPKDHLT